MSDLPLELFQKLPKTDLHVHLDGSLRLTTIMALAKEQGVELPATDEAGLRAAIHAGEDTGSLEEIYARIDELNRRGSRHAQDAVLLYILENVELDDESHRLLQHYYLNHSDTLPVEMRDRIRKLVR